MKNKVLKMIAITSLTFFCNSFSFSGGLVGSTDVVIDDNLKSAIGSMSRIRNTKDRTQIMYCYKATIVGANFSLNCVARNVKNVVRQCTTNDPVMMAAFSSINDSSFIRFLWNDRGECTLLTVGNGSPFGFRENQ